MSVRDEVSTELAEYLDRALAQGIAADTAVRMLTASGWPERVVYTALSDHYERTTGVALPARTMTVTSAKDAFFYLLLFASLATWTFAAGCMAFTLLDRWMPDPLFPGSGYDGGASFAVTASLAAMLVAFPIFLLVSRAVLVEGRKSPEKRESAVRKWLTYMALVVAACIVMGDLITAMTYLLRGELTGRFVGKALFVLVLAGGTFWYYFGGLRVGDAERRQAVGRDQRMGGISAAVVALLLVLGFTQAGSPAAQRELRADRQRVAALYRLTVTLGNAKLSHQALPEVLPAGNGVERDPLTHQPFEYHRIGESTYELCAVFARDSEGADTHGAESFWNHGRGRQCFDISQFTNVPMPMFAYGE